MGIHTVRLWIEKHTDIVVFTAILAFLLILLYETIHLPEIPRRVPSIILIPTILLTVVQLVILVFPDKFAKYEFNFFDEYEGSEELVEEPSEETDEDTLSAVYVVLWFLLLPTLVVLSGFVVGVFVFSSLYMYRVNGSKPVPSVLTGVVLSAFIYVVFIYGINVRPIDPILLPWFP